MNLFKKRLRPHLRASDTTWPLIALLLAACGGGGGGGGRTPTITADGIRPFNVPEGEVSVNIDTANIIRQLEREYEVNFVQVDEIGSDGKTGRYIVRSRETNAEIEVNVSISGEDAHLFKFVNKGKYGGVEFRFAPDFERPQDSGLDNIYKFTIVAKVFNGFTTSTLTKRYQAKVIDIKGDADPPPPLGLPAITTLQDNSRRVDVAEGETLVAANVLADINAFTPRGGRYERLDVAEDGTSASLIFSQADGTEVRVTYTLSGTDANLFKLDDIGKSGTFGGIAFRNAPDYENPQDTGGDNEYNFILTVSGESIDNSQINVRVRVTDLQGVSDPTPASASAGQLMMYSDDMMEANDNLPLSEVEII